MWLWKKGVAEEIEFEEENFRMEGVIPLGYIADDKKRSIEIVGTDSERKKIYVLLREEEGFSINTTIDLPSATLDYIVPIDIIVGGEREYIFLSQKEGKGFKIFKISKEDPVETFLGYSDSMPFLVSYEDLDPSLFIQNEGSTYLYNLNKRIFSKQTEPFGILQEMHSSGFVDTTGDGISDLVLDTVKNGKRVIEVWVKKEEDFIPGGSFSLPDNSGPIVFGDFTGTGSIDILYLTNSTPTINIVPNKRPSHCTVEVTNNCLFKNSIMGETPLAGYSVEETIEYAIAGVKEFFLYDENGPIFPSVLDINRNTYLDVMAIGTVSDEPSKALPIILVNADGEGFNAKGLPTSIAGRITTSSFYRGDRSVWDIVVSTQEDGENYIYVLRNKSDIPGYYLSIYTKLERDTSSHVTPIVGANYACRIAETGRVIVGFYPPQSGYRSMQSPITTLGLGNTTVFISALHSRAPSDKYKTGIIQDKIVPNSELLMGISSKNHIKSSLYLNVNAYWSVAIPIILGILFLLIITTTYFSIKMKTYVKKKPRRTRYDVAFGAL